MNKILIVAPHPDDETLGCGGTLLKHKKKGDKIYWLIITSMSAEGGFPKAQVEAREKEINAVSKAYGFERVFSLAMPVTRIDTLPRAEIVRKIGKVIEMVKPTALYLPFKNDVHSDHRVVFDSAISSGKTFRFPSIKKLMMYEAISETEFSAPLKDNIFMPNNFSDITGYIDKKITIMNLYKSELGPPPFPRSKQNIKALATFRGSTAGVRYAEAFMTLKEIW